MSIQIKKKFIGSQVIDGSKILFLNDEAFKAKNSSGAEVSLFKLGTDNKLQFLEMPQLSSDPSAAEDIARKGYVDFKVSAEETRALAAEAALEAEIDALSSSGGAAVAAVQDELDDTQVGAGLGTDGSYSAPVGSNYLGSAVSLKDADSKLDAAIKAEETARIADVDAEQSRAEAAEGALDARLDIIEGADTVEGSVAKAEKDAKDYTDALEAEFDAFVATKAQPGGLASLDMNGKLPSAQVPAIAITDVFVVADIAARDALGGIEEGDVAKVADAGAGLPKTYIHDGTQWIEIESGSDVDSVNGQVGTVVLSGSDIGLSSPVMLQPDVQSALSALEQEDLTFLKLDGTRAMTAPLAMGTFDITDAANIDAFSLNVSGAAATSIVSGTSITLDAPIVEVATSLTTEKVEGGFYSLESGVGLSFTDANSEVSVASGAAVLSGEELAFSSPSGGKVSGLSQLYGTDPADVATPKGYVDGLIAQEVIDRNSAISTAVSDLVDGAPALLDTLNELAAAINDDENFAATIAGQIGALDSRADALEAASVEFKPVEKFVLDATDISNGYITLSYLAIQHSLRVSVDRLAIHQGAANDYTVSTFGGVTRITFVNSLVTSGQEQLSVGDQVYVEGAKLAIVTV